MKWKKTLFLTFAAFLSALCVIVAGADGNTTTITPDGSGNGSGAMAITLNIAPPYTVTATDGSTPENAKKYHYGGEDITLSVMVSGADFEGGEFTLNYDSNTLAVKTLPTNNLIAASEQETGKIKFEAQEKKTITNGQALATIVFTVKTKVATETTCNFTFEGTPKICYNTSKDSVEAKTATNGSVIVEPVTYTVELKPTPSDLTLTGDNGVASVDNGKAIDGQDYSVTIGGYSATDYEYAVTLAVEGTDGTTTLTPSDTGVITVAAANVTGNLTITVTRTTKHVTATLTASPTGEFTLSGLTTKPDNTTVTDAIKGLNYVVTIGGYSATDYEYAVTLAVEGTDGTTTLTPSDAGVITVEAAKVTGNLTVTVTRTTKHVTPTLVASPTGEFTLSGLTTKPDTTTVTDAIKGLNYVVTISDYDAANYAYAVTLTMNGASATAPTPDTDGKLTIEGANITGDFTLTVTRTTKHVTATLEGGLLSGSTDAIKGEDYTATISDYDANNYTYAVTLTMNNASADDKATMSGGTITIDGDDITGDFTLTVTKTLANFTVTTTADYVTGWTLVTVAKTAANNGSPVYKYAGNDMYYVEAYSAYAYLVNVEGGVTVADATANVTLGDTEAVTIAAGYDVNNTGKVDYSDTLLTYRCYEKVHQTPATAMETYLRADVNNSKKVDTEDVSAIDENRTPES